MPKSKEILTPGALSTAQLRRLTFEGVLAELDPACRAGIQASAAFVRRATDNDAAVYGVNTGFGKL
nr:aromatic amino acid lyase [Lautropia sp.]